MPRGDFSSDPGHLPDDAHRQSFSPANPTGEQTVGEGLDGACRVISVDTSVTLYTGSPSETDLISYAMPAGILAHDGDSVDIVAGGVFNSNANAKQLRLYFGSTVLVTSGSSTLLNAIDWGVWATVTRISATSQVAVGRFVSGTGVIDVVDKTVPAETLSGVVTIKCTGVGVADSDLQQSAHRVTLCPGA